MTNEELNELNKLKLSIDELEQFIEYFTTQSTRFPGEETLCISKRCREITVCDVVYEWDHQLTKKVITLLRNQLKEIKRKFASYKIVQKGKLK